MRRRSVRVALADAEANGPPHATNRRSAMWVATLIVAVLGASLVTVGTGTLASQAQEPEETALPPLPLPDCRANGLNSVDPETDCEGTYVVVNSNDRNPVPDFDQVKLIPSFRPLDFRLQADRGSVQDIVIDWPTPPPLRFTNNGSDGEEYDAVVERFWPEIIQRGSVYVQERSLNERWDSTTELQLVRQGECGEQAASCTYRVEWSPYATAGFVERTRKPELWRIGLPWTVAGPRSRHRQERLRPGLRDHVVHPQLTAATTAAGGGHHSPARTGPVRVHGRRLRPRRRRDRREVVSVVQEQRNAHLHER